MLTRAGTRSLLAPRWSRGRWSVALAVALTVIGCGGQPAELARARIALHSDPLSLDPHLQNEMLTFSALLNMYEGLTGFDANLEVQPLLAARWDSPDELTWRFELRPDVRFHDGTPVTAADVVASLERARHHRRSNVASYLVAVDSVVAVDPTVVEIKTARPYAILPNKLVWVAILPAAVADEITEPMGTGPYRFVSFTRGGKLTLERFAGYWQPPIGPERLEFLAASGADRAAQLRAGEVEMVRDLPFDLAKEVGDDPCCRVDMRLGMRVEYLHLSPRRPPFDDPRVRQAIDLAIDREALAAGRGKAIGQMVSPSVFGFDPDLAPPQRDLTEARRLLAAAGRAEGLELVLEVREGRDPSALVAQLAEAGIEVVPAVTPWLVLFERLRAGHVAFYFGGLLAPSADASDVLEGFVHTLMPESSYGASNFARYTNPEVDDLVAQSSSARLPSERLRLLRAALAKLREDNVYVPLMVEGDVYGSRRSISWEPRLDSLVMGRSIHPAR